MKNVRKNITKIFRFVFFGFGIFIIIFFLSAFILLNTKGGKSLTANIISNQIKKQLDINVEIESAKIIIFSHLILENVKLYDLHDNPLLVSSEILLEFNISSFTKKKTQLRKLIVNDLVTTIKKYDNDQQFNIEYIVEAFKNKNPNKNSVKKKLIIDKIIINNSKFNFISPTTDKIKGKFDYENIRTKDLYIAANKLEITGSRMTVNIETLKTTDHSGLSIKSFTSNITIDSNQLYFNKFSLLTNESDIKGDIEFSFTNFQAFQEVIDSVNIDLILVSSDISLNDMKYFSNEIISNNNSISLNGHISGCISNLKSEEIKVSFGDRSFYNGRVHLSGLPNIEETFIDLSMKNTNLLFRDIQSLIPRIDFPEYFHNLDLVNFSGKYTGFIYDFVAYGQLNTPLGRIMTDINFKIPSQSKIPQYSGKITLENFSLGKFVNQDKLLNKITMSGAIDGKGITLEDLQANLNVNIQNIDFNNYSYNNVTFNGDISQEIFEGWLTITDENVGLIFNGTIDMTQVTPTYKFVATVNNTNLYKLNFVKDSLTLSCLMDINIKGNNIDDLEGQIIIRDSDFKLAKTSYQFDQMVISSSLENELKNITINSDLANAKINGKFSISTLPDLLKKSIVNYLDTSFLSFNEGYSSDDFINFDVKLLNTSFLNKLVGLNIIFENNTHLEGSINNQKNIFDLKCHIPGLYYKEYYINNLSLTAKDQNKSLLLNSAFDEILRQDSTYAENIRIQTLSNRENIHFDLKFSNNSYKSQLELRGNMQLRKDSCELVLQNSSIISDKKTWVVNSDNIKIFYKPEIQISRLEALSNNQRITIFGAISKDNRKSLRCDIDNVDLTTIDNYLNIDLSSFSGNLNGHLKIFSLLGNPYFEAGIFINPIIYNDVDTLGILTFTSINSTATDQINIDGTLLSSEFDDILKLNGYIGYSKSDKINLTIDISESDVKNFAGFTKEYISDLVGTVTAKINITGQSDKPEINGILSISDFTFTLNYLQTRYKFSHNFRIDQNKMVVDQLNCYDEYSNIATVNGLITHDYFSNFNIDLQIKANDFYCMNTTIDDNSIFYGKAFGDGILDISGPIDDLKFDINAILGDNTKIYLPVYGDDEYGEYRYIRYTNKFDKHRNKPQVNLLGIAVNVNVEINSETDVEIIFDPVSGDIMRGNGKGNLKIELDNLGNVMMYGSYFIESGEYVFSALNLIKRKFTVKEGSSITWKGDPEQADVNIEAVYKLNADISELTTEHKAERLPVHTKILLTESLFLPNIKLDFDIINIGSVGSKDMEFEQKIRIIKSSQPELNKQVVSLLALGRFAPVESGIGFENVVSQGINNNVGALISNQLSQWLSEASSNFNSKYFGGFRVGVDYADHGQVDADNQKDLDVLLSTSLFDDRVTIDGSYDVYDYHDENPGTNMPNFEVSYRGKKRRNTRLKIFSRSENNPIINQNSSRLGFGVFFIKEFDNISDFLKAKNKQDIVPNE